MEGRYRVSSDEFKITNGATLSAKGHIRRNTVAAISRSRGSRGGHGTRERTNVAPEKAVFSQFNTGGLKETEKMQKKKKETQPVTRSACVLVITKITNMKIKDTVLPY